MAVSLIAVVMFYVLAYVMLAWARDVKSERLYSSEAAGLLQVQLAVSAYAKANQAAFKAGKTVMWVNDQYNPTIAELQAGGFLTSNGVEVTAPWGRTFRTTLTLQPTGAVTGWVQLDGSILDSASAPDRIHACNIAKTMTDVGLCTPPNNPAVLGNLNSQVTNLAGPSAGVVGALVSIPP